MMKRVADPQEAMLLDHFRDLDPQARNAVVYLSERWKALTPDHRALIYEIVDVWHGMILKARAR